MCGDHWPLPPEQRQNRGNNYLAAFARLKPGVSLQQAQGGDGHALRQPGERKFIEQRRESAPRSVAAVYVGRYRAESYVVTFGLAGCVLLIACANLANLQLVRTAARAREYAVRAALGAGRFRLLRQSLTESLAIALLGGALSLLLAFLGVEFISRRLFSELPGAQVTLDFSVFGFALLCSVLTGLIFGTVPAWLASRADVNQALKENLRGSTTSAHHRLRHALIVGEVAFALILLTGAGLFLRGAATLHPA